MRIWSILLIKSDLKWCIHLSKSLFLYPYMIQNCWGHYIYNWNIVACDVKQPISLTWTHSKLVRFTPSWVWVTEFSVLVFYVTCNDISVIYVTAQMCRRTEEEVVPKFGSNAMDKTFFIRLLVSEKLILLVAFYDTLGIRRTYSRLSPRILTGDYAVTSLVKVHPVKYNWNIFECGVKLSMEPTNRWTSKFHIMQGYYRTMQRFHCKGGVQVAWLTPRASPRDNDLRNHCNIFWVNGGIHSKNGGKTASCAKFW